MGKCLVTTLDVVVNNPELPKIGELVIPFKAGTEVSLSLASNAAGNNVSINKAKFSNHNTNSVDFGTTAVTVNYGGEEDCVIRIKDKYLLTRFEIVGGDVDFVEGMFDYITCGVPNATRVFVIPNSYGLNVETLMANTDTEKVVSMVGTGMSGRLNNLKIYPALKCYDSPKLNGKPSSYYTPYQILLTNTAVSLNLVELASFTTINTLNFTGSSSIIGNLNSLGALTSLATLDCNGTAIIGALEDLGSLQYAAGRTSGFIRVTCNGIITMVVEGAATALPAGTVKYIRFFAGGYTIQDS